MSKWLRWAKYFFAGWLSWRLLRMIIKLELDFFSGTFYVKGRELRDTERRPVILRGVNKMSVFDNTDPQGAISFPEISKTGANSVRIVWGITKNLQPGGTATSHSDLDALITNAKNNKLIPMIELHDATGKWDRLTELVNYWVRPEIVSIIKKHEKYLLVNIGNEVGDDNIAKNPPNTFLGKMQADNKVKFIVDYTNAIIRMRDAGIRVPLVIDAPDFGKDLDMLNDTAATLLMQDPLKKLIFSVHTYWSIQHQGADANFIKTKLQNAVALNYALIVGEFSQWGAYNNGQDICSGGGEVDYKAILKECHEQGIGWYAWEWGGPANGYIPGSQPARYDGPCQVMDMTPDKMFNSLKPGWAEETATSSPYSIKNTSKLHL